MVPEQIEREIVINAPIQRVWSIITEAQHVGTWFGDAGAEIDLRPGGAMEMRWSKYGNTHAVIERVEPPHVFSYRWARPVGTPVGDGNSTLVEFTLTAEDGHTTRLRVVESGFRTLSIPEEEQAKYAEGNVRGWHMELDELAEYIATVSQ